MKVMFTPPPQNYLPLNNNILMAPLLKYKTILLVLILAISQNLYSQQITAYDQLVEVNKEWKKQADAHPSLKKTSIP